MPPHTDLDFEEVRCGMQPPAGRPMCLNCRSWAAVVVAGRK
jgi:hypothetical protein